MSGSKTFDRLKENDPGVRVILSAGYRIGGQGTGIIEGVAVELSQRLREVLET